MATPQQALVKLKHYCAYQERCHREVKKKLSQLGVWGFDAEEIIATLIQEDFLNEEHYAQSFARGKFKMNKWGKNKIRYALKRNQVSPYCIQKAMREIEEEEYILTLRTLAQKKYRTLKKEQYLRRKYKVKDHLIRKGYEPELVKKVLQEITESND